MPVGPTPHAIGRQPAAPPETPRWLQRLRTATVGGVIGLFLIQMVLAPLLRYRDLAALIAETFLWACGLLAAVGTLGALVTGRPRWLWFAPAAGALALLTLLIAFSRMTWGM